MYGFLVRHGLSNTHNLYSLPLALLSSMLLLTGCTGREMNGERPLVKALSDFIFVASGPYDVKVVPAHTMNALQMPTHFKGGDQYVFHHKKLEDDADLYKNLLTKLQAEGFQIISANNSTHRYVGGPLFRINFQGHGLKGFIFNTLDDQILNNDELFKGWDLDDYVLVLENV